MNESKLKGEYLIYILKRCVNTYEDIPKDKTLSYLEFKNKEKIMVSQFENNMLMNFLISEDNKKLRKEGIEFQIGDKYKVLEEFHITVFDKEGIETKRYNKNEEIKIRVTNLYDQCYGYGQGHLVFVDKDDKPLFSCYDEKIKYLKKI